MKIIVKTMKVLVNHRNQQQGDRFDSVVVSCTSTSLKQEACFSVKSVTGRCTEIQTQSTKDSICPID